MRVFGSLLVLFACGFGLFACGFAVAADWVSDPPGTTLGPRAGDLYREFAHHAGGDRDWRITDDEAVKQFPRAADHLPNSVLQLEIADLEHAVRAEAVLDRWGGHRGTINKRIRFNDADWIVVPEIDGLPRGHRGEHLMYQDNPVIAVPLSNLVEGVNTFEGDCDEAGGFGWGQWGLYSVVVRIYYDREAKQEHAIDAKITSPVSGATIGDDPTIEIEPDASMGVARVDVLASYNGYDEDGDGDFGGYHESRFQLVSGQPNQTRDHVGTLWGKPYALTWDTHWVPDQKPGGVKLIARVQDSRGYWSVSEPVTGLTLRRDDVSVKLYRSEGVPEDFAVRVGETKTCTFTIPESDNVAAVDEAILHLRTWHGWDGHHDPIRINDHSMPVDGKNHLYDYDKLSFPPSVLKSGTNLFTIESRTEHHMLEVLWPGPAIAVRTVTHQETPAGPVIGEATYQDRPHFVIRTRAATYWLDKNSGGLSRMIDRDGNDWIAFKMKPWGDYPDAAAGAFRGIPNLLYGVEEGGFGHPGHDRGTSRITGDGVIESTSHSGKWKLRWTFTDDDVHLSVETDDEATKYWFLYEGTIAGRFAPKEQYFATDTRSPVTRPLDYYGGEKWFDHCRWAYFGDQTVDRVVAMVHEQADDRLDTFAHLGDSSKGLGSEDGMVVFGFGRGKVGTQPLLTGNSSFRIVWIERGGATETDYRAIKKIIQQETP